MAIESGFFDGDTEYGQAEFNRYFAYIYESGVSVDDDGTVQYKVGIENGKIIVNEGFAILKGFYGYNNAPIELNVTETLNAQRIDRVVLRANLLSGPVEVLIKEGSEENAPQLQRDNDIYEISLARVVIYKNEIVEVNDERADNEVCGLIRPKNLVEYQEFLKLCRSRFETWFAEQQSNGWRNIFIQSSRPENAAEGGVWIKTE